ncbi:AI-2E family transporter [Brachyspira hyodysenteriae]|uniref:PerM, Predicted permease n=2 Tax=Brachyspira hyodysenteriae TaxID=159 RepID=A0A3B6V8J2_BRAHW|nr:AI-2E family transporter [Brachyspira hyodysenteriae]ACN82885.1 PerM, Predicted permease [Brachyspira hyodysenteriae WA1]ANN62373.2 AI-2E family transporter [Brachyspira hyodysenteriae ATCC 27164]AUJ48632.1 AI-2E family transporter [Brachyspira hyodysenteriae]KLI15094.1 permease [Brachyspira hyodysenteriae]KLI17617.1 permease [Brachyspira hyodysenteriae]
MINKNNFFSKDNNSLTHNKILVIGGEILLIAIVFSAFFYFCYLIRDIINPIILFIILIVALIPFWKYIWAKTSIVLILALFTLWVIKEAGYLVAPFIWGIFIAYMFDPLITKMQNKIPRLAAVLLIYIPLLILAIIFVVFILPRTIEQIEVILKTLPQYVDKIYNSISDMLISLSEKLNRTIGKSFDINLEIDSKAINDFLFGNSGVITLMYRKIIDFRFQNINSITTIFSIIFSYFVILPFVTFYLMLDFQNIKDRIIKIIPMRWQSSVSNIIKNSNYIINSYVVGMTILAISFFIISYILLSVTNTKYAFILALLRGILNYIPFIGPFAAFISALFIGIITEPVWWHGALKMCIIYGIIQILDSGIMAPKILGKSVKIHPIAVMFSTIIGGVLFGFLGVLFAVPFCGIIIITIKNFFNKYYHSKFYTLTKRGE